MNYVGKTWVDRQSEYPTRRKLTNTSDITDVKEVTVVRVEGTVTVQGDVFDAATMNNLEARIAAGFASIWKDVTGTLTAGETTLVISDSAILAESTVQVFVDPAFGDVSYNTITVATGSVTLTFDAQSSNMPVKVRVS